MKYGISKYPYYNAHFKTNEYYEVYRYDETKNECGTGIALFGNREDAEQYLEMKEREDEERA